MQQQLQRPTPVVTTFSDSHLCVPKEAILNAASIESIDIDQGGSEDLDLIEKRRRHCDIIETLTAKHGQDFFPYDLIWKKYAQDKRDLSLALRTWSSTILPYKFQLNSGGVHFHVFGKKGKGCTYKWKCKDCNFKILAEENAKFQEAAEVLKSERIKLPADASIEEDDKLFPPPCLAKLNLRSNVAEALQGRP